jgi:hypothetical protein
VGGKEYGKKEKKEEKFTRTKGGKKYRESLKETNIERWKKLKTFIGSFTLNSLEITALRTRQNNSVHRNYQVL